MNTKIGTAVAAAISVLGAGSAAAFTFDMENGISGNLDSTIRAGVGVRANSPGCDTVIGTYLGGATPASGPNAPAGCVDAASGYNDQGNLNYKKGQAFTEYLNGTHELLLKLPDDYKFMTRVNWMKDFAAGHPTDDISGVGTASYPGDAQRQITFKTRILDFWVSKEFDLNDERARIRIGEQVINWGESLFLPGGINQTNAMDLMRLSQPGTQLKEVMLPAPIVSFATGLGHGFNAEAYAQADWNGNFFPPVGSYWSTATVGNGAAAAGIPTTSTPANHGQYGFALRYQPTGTQANVGVYAMQYHDKSPVISYNQIANTYSYSYLEDRRLYGISANMPIGNWAFGTELSYRPKDAVSLGGTCLANSNCWVDEKKYQLAVTGILSLTPGDYGTLLDLLGHADTATLLAEAAMVRYPNLQSSYGGAPVAAGLWGWGFLNASSPTFGTAQSVGDKTSWGYNFDFSWTYDGSVIPGWQVTPEVYYFDAVSGRTPNAMGLFMQGAKSANFIVTFAQNPTTWQFGLNYAKFMGGSSLFDQPLKDRDFYGAYVQFNF